MKATTQKKQLIAECRSLLGDNFSDVKMKEFFTVISVARSKGFLGCEKPRCCCFHRAVNAANDLLRICNADKELATALASAEENIYAYISLVALNCVAITA